MCGIRVLDLVRLAYLETKILIHNSSSTTSTFTPRQLKIDTTHQFNMSAAPWSCIEPILADCGVVNVRRTQIFLSMEELTSLSACRKTAYLLNLVVRH